MERDALGAWAAWEAREAERRAALRLVKVLFLGGLLGPLAGRAGGMGRLPSRGAGAD